ncbi:beta-microseminoprotein-like [Lepisosteus oculatus]|uniref:beta-microseminoprotein-like n=1 Tax=Lepisosteus oculatus TaxID=7918 RepID=UPI0007402F81|nr:PREDICTED: beta-microseminoprotein E1-like [Lepisosteus oculatus]
MKSLAVALLLCAVLHLSQPGCYHVELTMKPGMNPKLLTHCEDPVDKTLHEMGSRWRNSKCQDCTCGRCCDAYSTPVRFPDDCMKEFDWENCEYKVFKKNDHTQPCPIFGATGK